MTSKIGLYVSIILVPVALFTAQASFACDRDSWVPISEAELSKAGWRASSPTNFANIDLDMNGDGVSDSASLVVSKDGKQSGVKVCLAVNAADRKSECTVIGISENIAEVMGLQKLPAGCRAYEEDDQGTPSRGKRICTDTEAFSYFRFGSAGSFFIFDSTSGKFDRYWDSD